MRLEHYPVEKLKKEILEILQKHLDLKNYRLFFFGSRVLEKGDDRSDIDIGIEGHAAIQQKILSEIQEEIENLPTLYKIELVDFYKAPKKFKEVALEKIEYIANTTK